MIRRAPAVDGPTAERLAFRLDDEASSTASTGSGLRFRA